MIKSPKQKKGKMPFRKGFLHGENERKLRDLFKWTQEEMENLRCKATNYQ